MNKQKGFTLIELLVVIAIIGILASLVLVALGNARDKANDARVKSNVSQLRTLAESVYDNSSSSYETVEECFNTATPLAADCKGVETSVDTIQTDNDAATGVANSVVSNSTASAYCVASVMKSNTSTFCADSTGKAIVSAQTTGILACPAAAACVP